MDPNREGPILGDMEETAIEVLLRYHDIQQGLFDKLPEPGTDRTRIWSELVKQIATHVAVERTFVYPLVKRRRIGPQNLGHDLWHDYKRMEHLLVLTDRRKLNSPDMPQLINELLDVFETHRDRCSTVLVPTMREQLSTTEVDQLGTKMRAAENVILSHPHPYLLKTGPIYPLTTRIASTWDRLRDRTVRNR